jgi:hypothetical protein
MIDRRYVYIMKRTGKTRARLADCRRVMNARKVERRLHKIFASSRFVMRKRKRMPWFGYHIKIGIATNPKERNADVDGNLYGSGKTEWFHLSAADLAYCHLLLFWFQLRPAFVVAFWLALLIFYFVFFQKIDYGF